MSWRKNSVENKIKNQLLPRFQNQERITIDKTIEEFFETKTKYRYILVRDTVKKVFTAIKKSFLSQGIPFGALNKDNEWGIPTDETEYRYMGIKRYKLVKGIAFNTNIIAVSGKKKGFLKDSKEEDIPMLKLNGHKEKNENIIE